MRHLTIAAALILVVIVGCSPVPPGFVKKQTIKYKETNVTGLSRDKVDANVVFQEINRDSVTLDNVSLDYELYLEGQKFTAGRGVKLNFRANDTTDFVVPMEVNYIDFFKTAENMAKAELKGKKSLKFELRTVVTIYLSVVTLRIPVTAEGELPLPEVKKPQVKLKF